MKNLWIKLFTFLLVAGYSVTAFSQIKVKQVIVVSGGLFGAPGNMVQFGTYDPATKKYMVFDSIPGDYTNDAIVDGDHAYMTANNMVYKYDLDNYTRLDSVEVPGIQRLAVSDQYLIVSQGFGASTTPYTLFFDKTNLDPVSFQDTLSTDLSEGIFVSGNKTYVAVTGSWPDYLGKGQIVQYDLAKKEATGTIEFTDTNVHYTNTVYEHNGNIIAVSPDKGYVCIYNVTGKNYDYISSPGTVRGVGIDDDILWVHTFGGASGFDISQKQFDANYTVSSSFERATADTLNNLLYMAQTDFFSYGRVLVSDYNGQFTDSFETGIAPQAIAIQYKDMSSIESHDFANSLMLYPNPAHDQVVIQSPETIRQLSLFDLAGKEVLTQSPKAGNDKLEISLSTLPEGLYFIKAVTDKGIYSARILKQ